MTDAPTVVPNCSHYGPPALAWLDLETTGLAPTCGPIEIAVVVTDAKLNRLASITRKMRILDFYTVDPYAEKMHTDSGLWAECRGYGVAAASYVDHEIAAFLLDLAPSGTLRMAGNSIHFDRRVLTLHMPHTDAVLHYRQIDVSTIKELARLLRPDLKEPVKRKCHRAADDVEESRLELLYWLEQGIFKP